MAAARGHEPHAAGTRGEGATVDAVVASPPVIGGHDHRRVRAARPHATEDGDDVPQGRVGGAERREVAGVVVTVGVLVGVSQAEEHEPRPPGLEVTEAERRGERVGTVVAVAGEGLRRRALLEHLAHERVSVEHVLVRRRVAARRAGRGSPDRRSPRARSSATAEAMTATVGFGCRPDGRASLVHHRGHARPWSQSLRLAQPLLAVTAEDLRVPSRGARRSFDLDAADRRPSCPGAPGPAPRSATSA